MAEAWRNITAVGGRPLAVTDNLNFGNPERPEIMGQLVGCIRGIGEACRALDFPVVSGNVSLYNETNGRGILPTPTIGGVGLVDDVADARDRRLQARRATRSSWSARPRGWLGQSIYLREICGREEGAPPPVDLAAEKRNGDFVRQPDPRRPGRHRATTAPTAASPSRSPRWRWPAASARRSRPCPAGPAAHAFLFGEDQARYVLAVEPDPAADILSRPPRSACRRRSIGMTGGDSLMLPGDEAISVAPS